MTDFPKNAQRSSDRIEMSRKYAYLKAEAAAPYRGLRHFIYFACGASACIGGFILLCQWLAGTTTNSSLSGLAIQLGVLGLMVGLYRLDQARPKA